MARNVKRLLSRAKSDPARKEPTTPVEIEIATNGVVGKSKVYRILNQESDVQLDALENLARVFHVEAWTLLHPDIDPTHRFVVVFERELEDLVERRAAEMLNVMVAQLMAQQDDSAAGRAASSTPGGQVSASRSSGGKGSR